MYRVLSVCLRKLAKPMLNAEIALKIIIVFLCIYLTGWNLICFVNNIAEPNESERYVDPSSLEIGSVPYRMNQF